MGDLPDDRAVLDLAASYAHRWLDSVPDRRIPATGTADDAAARLGTALPARGSGPLEVIDRLAAAVEPGLMANASGRFYGWVMGSALPAAMAADWLVAAWDQNAGMRGATPGVVAVEEVAAAWLLELLGLPRMRPSASRPARRWPTSPASRRRAAGCSPTPAGTSTRTGSPAPAGPRPRRGRGPRLGGTGAPLSRTGAAGDGGLRRRGQAGRRRAAGRPRRGGRADDRLPAGGQHPLRRVRPVPRRGADRARRRRLGPRRRSVRPLGRGLSAARRPHRRRRGGRLLGDRCAQDPEHPLRLRDRRRGRRGPGPADDGCARQLPADRGGSGGPVRTRARDVPSCARGAGLGRAGRPGRRGGPGSRRRAHRRRPRHRRRRPRDPRCARAERRRLHAGHGGVRLRRPHPGRAPPAARGGNGDAVGQHVARCGGDPVLGQLLADRTDRGARDGRGRRSRGDRHVEAEAPSAVGEGAR